MITLVSAIEMIREAEYQHVGDKSYFSEEGVLDVKALLEFDRCFQSIPSDTYDAVILSCKDLINVNGRGFGDVFFDKNKRFPDGSFIITSRILAVEQLFSEIYRVKTKNSTYLVIM